MVGKRRTIPDGKNKGIQMSDTANRILISIGMFAILGAAIVMQRLGFNHAIAGLGIIICIAMIVEFLICLWRAPRDIMFDTKNIAIFLGFFAILGVDFMAILELGNRLHVLLMVLLIVSFADVFAWFFGKQIGGDKMWEKISANKTWAGQVFGIIGGVVGSIIYGWIVMPRIDPRVALAGIAIALLSQYGDLTASFVKRRLQIKDFGRILGKHGGIIDRFDGWIYVLPVLWIMLMCQ